MNVLQRILARANQYVVHAIMVVGAVLLLVGYSIHGIWGDYEWTCSLFYALQALYIVLVTGGLCLVPTSYKWVKPLSTLFFWLAVSNLIDEVLSANTSMTQSELYFGLLAILACIIHIIKLYHPYYANRINTYH
jgi:hypothetical protein